MVSHSNPLQWRNINVIASQIVALLWRHNGRVAVSNHQPSDCLLNRLFRRRSKQTLKHRVTGLCAGNSPGPVNSPHKWPVTRKMFPFDDVIMDNYNRQIDCLFHHNNVTWTLWHPISLATRQMVQQIVQGDNSENITGPYYLPLFRGNPRKDFFD